MRVTASPRRAKAGVATRFRFKVTTPNGRRQVPVRGATVAFGRARARTDRTGRASLIYRLPAGRYRVRTAHAQLRGGSTIVRVAP